MLCISAVPKTGSSSFRVSTFVGTSDQWKLINTSPRDYLFCYFRLDLKGSATGTYFKKTTLVNNTDRNQKIASFVPVDYTEPLELPDEQYPFTLTTGL